MSGTKWQRPSGGFKKPSAGPKPNGSTLKRNGTNSTANWKTRPALILSGFLSLSLLSGCGGSIPTSNPPQDWPPSLVRPCNKPVLIPGRDLSDQEVEVFWGRDRKSLLDCRGRFEVIAGRPPQGR